MSRIPIQLLSKQRHTYLIQINTHGYSQIQPSIAFHKLAASLSTAASEPTSSKQTRTTKSAYLMPCLDFFKHMMPRLPPLLYLPPPTRAMASLSHCSSPCLTSARRYITKRYKQNPQRPHECIAPPPPSGGSQRPWKSSLTPTAPSPSSFLSPGLGILCVKAHDRWLAGCPDAIMRMIRAKREMSVWIGNGARVY